jgi:hypothetical protein
MAKVKYHPNAKAMIDEGIKGAEPFARAICHKLREIIFKAEPTIIEDWKWGPNYYKDGMVCGFWYFKHHVTFTFFQGAMLKDEKNVLQVNSGNINNRHLKFTDIKQINERLLIQYLREAVNNNQKGLKIIQSADKTVVIPADLKKLMVKNKVLVHFEDLSYSKRKDYVQWVEAAKQDETRMRRMLQAVDKLKLSLGLNDHYNKKK